MVDAYWIGLAGKDVSVLLRRKGGTVVVGVPGCVRCGRYLIYAVASRVVM
jgi:hypothetical protein